jgi:hypothetical protein
MEWISIKEKLPTYDKHTSVEVLVYTKNRNVLNAWYEGSDGSFDLCADEESILDFTTDKDEVTHWIRLRDVQNPNQPERLSEKTYGFDWTRFSEEYPKIGQYILVYDNIIFTAKVISTNIIECMCQHCSLDCHKPIIVNDNMRWKYLTRPSKHEMR